jgi:hypothetical protein
LDSDRTIAQYPHTAWGSKDGAPSSVTALAQTSDGYLWLGSTDGLYRFDGVVFERYQPQSGGPFSARHVNSLLALPNGDLWVAFRVGGISLLKRGNATNYTTLDGVPEGLVFSFAQDGIGNNLQPAAGWRGWKVVDGRKWERIGISQERFPAHFLSIVKEPFGFLLTLRWFFFRPARSGFNRQIFESEKWHNSHSRQVGSCGWLKRRDQSGPSLYPTSM